MVDARHSGPPRRPTPPSDRLKRSIPILYRADPAGIDRSGQSAPNRRSVSTWSHPRRGSASGSSFAVDPLEQVIGAPVADMLESLMIGPVTQRPFQAGPAVDVYPLALPDGEGLTLPLGRWGELGFRNERSMLVLTVPLPAVTWVQRRLATAVVRGPDHLLSQDGTARVARFWLRFAAGDERCVPAGRARGDRAGSPGLMVRSARIEPLAKSLPNRPSNRQFPADSPRAAMPRDALSNSIDTNGRQSGASSNRTRIPRRYWRGAVQDDARPRCFHGIRCRDELSLLWLILLVGAIGGGFT